MFASLRSIIQTSRLQPALNASRATFSSSAATWNNAATPRHDTAGDTKALLKIITEEGVKQESTPAVQAGGAAAAAGAYSVKKASLREFQRNRPIQPYHFEREMRTKKRAIRLKPWDLGLPTRQARYHDVFHQLDIDPIDECMNTTLLSNYVSKMGMVNKRALTKLTMRSQRKLSKAIKRAKMMGIMPIHSQSPRGLLNFSTLQY